MNADIVELWKDPDMRASGADLAHPAGAIELAAPTYVGAASEHFMTLGCCQGLTSDPGYCSLGCGDDTASYCTQFRCGGDPANAFGALSGGCCMADV